MLTDLADTSAYVANRIRRIRMLRGFSLTQLADRCQRAGLTLSKQVIHEIELPRPGHRQRKVRVEELIALARALDVSVHLLLPPEDVDADQKVLRDLVNDAIALALRTQEVSTDGQ